MKKIILMVFLALALILGIIFYWLWHVRKGGPDETLPPWSGLAVKKHNSTNISFGMGYIAIVKENGELWIWGVDKNRSENHDRIEDAWKLADNVAKAIPLAPWSDSEAPLFLGILFKDGSFWIWDIAVEMNALGQLQPSHFMPAPEKIMIGVSDISADSNSFFALKTNHSLWNVSAKTWLKKPSFYDKVFITYKKQDNVKAFWINPTDYSQVYMLTKDGNLIGFGENGQGQLGVGFRGGEIENNYLLVPREVTDSVSSVITTLDWVELYTRTMALKNDHSLWLWGYDIIYDPASGRLSSYVPVKVMDNVMSGSISSNHALIVKRDNSLWTWGYNNYGQLGTGNYEDITEPVKIMDDTISVFAGFDYSIALQEDHTLWAWGSNEFGQLGTGDTASRTEPVKIMEDIAAFEMYSHCNVAVKEDGSIWLWGHPTTHIDAIQPDEGVYISTPVCIMQ